MKWFSYFGLKMDRYILHILNLITLFFLFRSSFPAFKYPFIVLYFIILVYLFLGKNVNLSEWRQILKSYIVAILLIVVFSVAVFSTYKLYLDVVKDLVNTYIILSIGFFYNIIIKSQKQLRQALSNLLNWIILLSSFVAVIWISDFIIIYTPFNNGIRLLDHMIMDYNFATIPALFGVVSGLFMMSGNVTKAKRYQLNFLLLLLYLQLFLSSSRRGFIICGTLLLIIFLLYAVSFIVKTEWILKFAKNITPFIVIFVAALLTGFLFVRQTTFDFKTNFFKKLGIVNGVGLANEITEKYLRFINILDPGKTSFELFDEVWKPNLDPKDPDSGWGTKYHKTVFPLTGRNVGIVPEGAKGYYMDNTSSVYVNDGNSYSITNVDMETHTVLEKDTVRSSIYCFVSEDYDGDWVFSVLTDNNGQWIGYAYYDLNNKGCWQELFIQMSVPVGRVSTNIFFTKRGALSFSDLTGHVIFAYPKFENISQNRRESIVSTINSLKQQETSIGIYPRTTELNYNFLKSSSNPIYLLSGFSRLHSGDPIRNLIVKFFPKDTTFLAYRSNLQVGSASNKAGEERIVRWKFAWQIFKVEYNWTQRFFGKGFSFLGWYGYYFLKDKKEVDWPHNPFMSILLYSGILGLMIYLLFLYKVFFYYIKYFKEYPTLFLFFLITFFFAFFSSGSPFDPPVFGFFSILPFFIHSVHKREKEDLAQQAIAKIEPDKSSKV